MRQALSMAYFKPGLYVFLSRAPVVQMIILTEYGLLLFTDAESKRL
jgi:hypothetical protein